MAHLLFAPGLIAGSCPFPFCCPITHLSRLFWSSTTIPFHPMAPVMHVYRPIWLQEATKPQFCAAFWLLCDPHLHQYIVLLSIPIAPLVVLVSPQCLISLPMAIAYQTDLTSTLYDPQTDSQPHPTPTQSRDHCGHKLKYLSTLLQLKNTSSHYNPK